MTAAPTPLIKEAEGTCALMPPRLFGSVGYYAVVARYPNSAIDRNARYDKRCKATHRYAIADTRGRIELTVPVSRPSGASLWRQILVSDHAHWWTDHVTALESSYGRTPFFEFYIDRLLPLFRPRSLPTEESVVDLCVEADRAVRSILGLPQALSEAVGVITDYTRADFALLAPPSPYWQVRADRLGFIKDLSVLDLIFNLGPEAPLVFL